MKNVFFALAFMLVGTFAFANDYKTSKTEEIKAEQSINNMVFIDSISIDDDICTVSHKLKSQRSKTAHSFFCPKQQPTLKK